MTTVPIGIDNRSPSTLKKVAVGSLCFGAGFAIILVLIVVSLNWYSSRPHPWNAQAIKASFDRVYIVGSPNHFVFDYTLENLTNQDYKADVSDLKVLAKLQKQQSLVQTSDNELTLFPAKLFIPAKQRVRLVVNLVAYGYHEKDGFMPDPPDERTISDAQRKVFTEQLKAYLNTSLPNLDGYRVYDSVSRYEYDLPKGW